MKIQKLLFASYLTSFCITIILAGIDSDPMVSFGSLVTDIFFMSILCWILIFPMAMLLAKFNRRGVKNE